MRSIKLVKRDAINVFAMIIAHLALLSAYLKFIVAQLKQNSVVINIFISINDQ